jgi:ATP-dependent Clp protease ATP-binding subunit ClpA
MFERFTTEARQVVAGAQLEARRLNHGWIGTEHLLLALLTQDTASSAVLFRYELTHDAVLDAIRGCRGGDVLDADALTTLGIDLDAVRERVEATFGPGALDGGGRREQSPRGHIPFSRRAKKVLELSLREAIAMKSKSITDGHIALGILREGEGLAMKVLADRGIDVTELRRDLTAALQA